MPAAVEQHAGKKRERKRKHRSRLPCPVTLGRWLPTLSWGAGGTGCGDTAQDRRARRQASETHRGRRPWSFCIVGRESFEEACGGQGAPRGAGGTRTCSSSLHSGPLSAPFASVLGGTKLSLKFTLSSYLWGTPTDTARPPHPGGDPRKCRPHSVSHGGRASLG